MRGRGREGVSEGIAEGGREVETKGGGEWEGGREGGRERRRKGGWEEREARME